MIRLRRFLVVACGAGVAAFAACQVRGLDLLRDMASGFSKAQSLSANYTVTPIGAAALDFTVDVAKPNMVRFDGPTRLVIADGKQVTVFDKEENAYMRRPQTEADIDKILNPLTVSIFSPFFKSNLFSNVVNPKYVGSFSRRGATLQGFEYTQGTIPQEDWTIYLNPEDSLPRQARLAYKTDTGTLTTVLEMKSLSTGPVAPDRFQWTPPSDAKEVKWEPIDKPEWFTNPDDAALSADVSDRLVFLEFAQEDGLVDAYEKTTLRTPAVLAMKTDYVFCRIVPDHSGVFQKYGVRQVPTVLILDSDGKVLRRLVGTIPQAQVLGAMRAARSSSRPTGL